MRYLCGALFQGHNNGLGKEPRGTNCHLSTLFYDHNELALPGQVVDIMDYCSSCRKKYSLNVMPANAHQITWETTGINPRGETLMKYSVNLNLNIFNHSNIPTSVISKRKKFTDLTLGTNEVENLANDWYLMSLHYQITGILVSKWVT
jgi:hypothetical protein